MWESYQCELSPPPQTLPNFCVFSPLSITASLSSVTSQSMRYTANIIGFSQRRVPDMEMRRIDMRIKQTYVGQSPLPSVC